MSQERWHRVLSAMRWAWRGFKPKRHEPEAELSFTISIEADPLDGGYVAQVVDMPGVMSEGATEREALDNVIDALSEVFADRMHSRLPQSPVDDASSSHTGPRRVALAL